MKFMLKEAGSKFVVTKFFDRNLTDLAFVGVKLD